MGKSLFLPLLLLLLSPLAGWGQDEAFDNVGRTELDEEEEEKIQEGWNTEVSFGFDLSQLFQLNPKQGAGQNRFGLGTAITGSAIYKRNRILWENALLWQFGLQRLGAGTINIPEQNRQVKVPFQKTVDDLRLGSKIGYELGEGSPWYLSAAGTFQSLIAATYPGTSSYPGNFLTNFADTIVNSKFMSPATITLSAGIEYVPNENFSVFYAPLGAKWIVVSDDLVAAQGIHGNPVRGDRGPDGLFADFDNTFSQFGSLLIARYKNSWLTDDRLAFKSTLTLYSNYLENPQNIDVDWINDLSYEIVKNLKLRLLLTLFYDDDVNVLTTDPDGPNGIEVDAEGRPVLGPRVSITEQFLLSYSVSF